MWNTLREQMCVYLLFLTTETAVASCVNKSVSIEAHEAAAFTTVVVSTQNKTQSKQMS